MGPMYYGLTIVSRTPELVETSYILLEWLIFNIFDLKERPLRASQVSLTINWWTCLMIISESPSTMSWVIFIAFAACSNHQSRQACFDGGHRTLQGIEHEVDRSDCRIQSRHWISVIHPLDIRQERKETTHGNLILYMSQSHQVGFTSLTACTKLLDSFSLFLSIFLSYTL